MDGMFQQPWVLNEQLNRIDSIQSHRVVTVNVPLSHPVRQSRKTNSAFRPAPLHNTNCHRYSSSLPILSVSHQWLRAVCVSATSVAPSTAVVPVFRALRCLESCHQVQRWPSLLTESLDKCQGSEASKFLFGILWAPSTVTKGNSFHVGGPSLGIKS